MSADFRADELVRPRERTIVLDGSTAGIRLVLLGPPGSGKGTQAVPLARRFGAPHVATGDLLRFAVAWQTEIGLEAGSFMDAGELVPDRIVLELLRRRLSQDDAGSGFVLDGFPRNLEQAVALDALLARIDRGLDAAVLLEVPEELLMRRLSGRASCPVCGRTYNLLVASPRDAGRCDDDGADLRRRADDGPGVVRRRLAVFRAETAPVAEHYARKGLLAAVDGTGDVDAVGKRIAAAIGEAHVTVLGSPRRD